jgi:hypothetical protein
MRSKGGDDWLAGLGQLGVGRIAQEGAAPEQNDRFTLCAVRAKELAAG